MQMNDSFAYDDDDVNTNDLHEMFFVFLYAMFIMVMNLSTKMQLNDH